VGGVLKLVGRDNRSNRCDFAEPTAAAAAAAAVSCLGEGVPRGDVPAPADTNDDVDDDGDKVAVIDDVEIGPK
jgi:hypothetical protein